MQNIYDLSTSPENAYKSRVCILFRISILLYIIIIKIYLPTQFVAGAYHHKSPLI
jgi:hypothetical protein